MVFGLLLGFAMASGGDPSTTWDSFAMYEPAAGEKGNVTLISAKYTVPGNPVADDGSTPKWWVGLQSTDGNGVPMKPQITWQNSSWIINTEVLDYSPPMPLLQKENLAQKSYHARRCFVIKLHNTQTTY